MRCPPVSISSPVFKRMTAEDLNRISDTFTLRDFGEAESFRMQAPEKIANFRTTVTTVTACECETRDIGIPAAK
jgi:hypothetical protein